ncbi:MAG: ABC transporter [Planctomycetota bacterium]|nr:MAG: ABC transporter [Planctomycetota bacterium]
MGLVTPHFIDERLNSFLSEQNAGESDRIMAVVSSFLPDAQCQSNWFVLTKERLLIVAEMNGKYEILFSYILKDLKEVRSQALKGGGVIIVESNDVKQEVFRYPNSQGALFGSICDCIKGFLNNGQALTFEDTLKVVMKEELNKFCSKCHRPKLSDIKACPFCIDRKKVVFRILSYAKPFSGQLIIVVVLLAFSTLLQLLPAIITGKIVDKVLAQGQVDLLVPLLLALGGSMIIRTALGIVHARISVDIGANVTNVVRKETFDHLQKLGLNFFDKQNTGSLMSRVSHDSQSLQGFLSEGIQYTVHNFFLIFFIGITLIYLNPVLGCLILLPTPFVVLISKLSWRKLFSDFRQYSDSASNLTAFLSDSLNGIREVKTSGQEVRMQKRFAFWSDESRDKIVKAEKTLQSLIPLLNLIIQSSLIFVWYFGSKDVLFAQQNNPSDFSIGDLVAMIGLMGILFGPLQLLTRLNDWMTRAITAADRIFEILDVEPDVKNQEDAQNTKRLVGKVVFDNVVFGYEKHKPVIKTLSLDVKPGEMIGLVGKSGVGKSTIMKLLMRLYEVNDGSITIDGRNIKEYSIETLRENISVVMQDSFLFNRSIADNISFGHPEATRKEIILASIQANAHEFIMKSSHGYDTMVGERGLRMSGGERQRIAIARALLGDPRILILDEATSAVDTETEQKIQNALQHLIKGRTTFAIAHRLSTLRNADRLFVIEDGVVVESGSHDELVKKEDGIYKKLVTIQTDWAKKVFIGGD